MLEAAEMWKKKEPNAQKIIDYYSVFGENRIKYDVPLGIYEGEDEDYRD